MFSLHVRVATSVSSIRINFKPDLISFPGHMTPFVLMNNNFRPIITFVSKITDRSKKPPLSQIKPTFWTKVAMVLDINTPLARTYQVSKKMQGV